MTPRLPERVSNHPCSVLISRWNHALVVLERLRDNLMFSYYAFKEPYNNTMD